MKTFPSRGKKRGSARSRFHIRPAYSISTIQFSRKMAFRPRRGVSPVRRFFFLLFLSRVPPPRTRREKHLSVARASRCERISSISQGAGSYRFGYGSRKPRRILFLRKADKRLFTRVTRRPTRMPPSANVATFPTEYASVRLLLRSFANEAKIQFLFIIK